MPAMGSRYEADYYDTNGTTLLKKTTALPGGLSSKWGQRDADRSDIRHLGWQPGQHAGSQQPGGCLRCATNTADDDILGRDEQQYL